MPNDAMTDSTTRVEEPLVLTDEQLDQVAGGVYCSYAPALVVLHWMTGVNFGSFVCDDGMTR